MEIDHPLLCKLVELADCVDMAAMAAERGNDIALHAWLEEIRDDAGKLVEETEAWTNETGLQKWP